MTDSPVYRSFNEAVGIIIGQDGTAQLLIRDGKKHAYDSLSVDYTSMEEIVEAWLRVTHFPLSHFEKTLKPLPDLAQESGDGIAERD